MTKRSETAMYLEQAIKISGRTQKEISDVAGFNKSNVLSMMKQGIVKVPIARIPALATACGVNAANFVRVAMIEYHPEIWDVIQKHVGEVITDDEPELLQKPHTNKNNAHDVAKGEVMQEYRFQPTNNRPAFTFTGELIAKVSSERPGSKQWTEIEAYKTRGGRWVVRTIGAIGADVDHLDHRENTLVFNTEEEFTRKIGTGRLAEKLYRDLGFVEIYVN
jgi:predicted XRE-type DNA-binding protein